MAYFWYLANAFIDFTVTFRYKCITKHIKLPFGYYLITRILQKHIWTFSTSLLPTNSFRSQIRTFKYTQNVLANNMSTLAINGFETDCRISLVKVQRRGLTAEFIGKIKTKNQVTGCVGSLIDTNDKTMHVIIGTQVMQSARTISKRLPLSSPRVFMLPAA